MMKKPAAHKMTMVAVFVLAIAGLVSTTQSADALRVATAQVATETGTGSLDTIRINVDTMLNLTAQAVAFGAAIIAFPEFALQGDFHFILCKSPSDVKMFSEVLVPTGSALDCSSSSAASRLGCSTSALSIHISYNTVESDGTGKYFNTQVVVHNGMLVARYRKYNVFFKDCFDTPALELVTFPIKNVTFGIFTCYDILFDHPKMDLVQAGIKYFTYSSAIPLIGVEAVNLFSSINHVDVVSSNADSGQSEIVSDGKVLTRVSKKGSTIVVADI